MTYTSTLPQVFPRVAEVKASLANEIAAMLIEADDLAPHGSSFAITAEGAQPGFRRLWLSEVSFKRLNASDLWAFL